MIPFFFLIEATERRAFVEEVNSIDDKEVLRRMLIQKEQEKDNIAQNLDIAARLGLAISEENEELQMKLDLAQQAEAQAYLKVIFLLFFFLLLPFFLLFTLIM